MIGIAAAVAAFVLHVATASRYGYFRDELYFIACSKHLAWGYVDQPPLVAIAAFFSAPFHYDLVVLRMLPIVCASITVLVAVQIAKDLGGGRFAQLFCAVAVALTPAYLLLGNTLTTTSFEGLSWTLVTWCAIHIVRRGERSGAWWSGLAAAVAFGAYGKYSMGLLVVALLIGLLATPQRRVLRSWWTVLAGAIVCALVSPNLLWQAQHGWPFLEVLQGDAAHRHAFNTGLTLEYRAFFPNAVAFAGEQFLYTNPIAAPVWIAGLVLPFASRELRAMRFITVAYIALFAIAVALEAKGYYVIGIYASLFALGAVALERAAAFRRAALAVVAAVAIFTMPLSLPVLPLHDFISYTQMLGMTGKGGEPARLIQPVYAEEFGWNRLARDVSQFYNSLAPGTRGLTAIYADTYADAGAIDLFGPQYGLPAAISSQNSYWLWGTRGYDGNTMIAIGASRIDVLKRYYRHVTLITTSNEPLKWAVEGPSPIYLCTDPIMPLDQMWPHLRWYGA
ncbi:MAG TPA: glycosyltransferase family 39 protein [Candidatus Baltobacteraceae bacterium]|jgi:hypothetical protein|nr:glycosyltransferase family 39 protein [Candidatus Baltobacteraceae bacterium]